MTINCKGQILDLSRPKVMGILNLTPDSFHDGGRYTSVEAAVDKVGEMLEEGADFIDVGGYSTRPGATDIPVAEEIDRVAPVVAKLLEVFPEVLLSIDSFRSEVARSCLELGAALINDVSGGELDPEMWNTVAEFQVPYAIMHMRGNPGNMQEKTQYTDLVPEVLQYFAQKIAKARQLKLNDLILDPGFGFAKTTAQNFLLLSQLQLISQLEFPLLVGLSRKSMIYKTLDTDSSQALNGSTALHMTALLKGANILRVHDVKEAVECVRLFNALRLAEK